LSEIKFINLIIKYIMKRILIFALPIALFFASCGGAEEHGDSPAVDSSASATPEEPSTPGEASLTIKVIGNTMTDMAYEPASASVKAGDKVTVTLINENTAEAMLHNWVLVQLGSGQEVATAAIAAGPDVDYIPENANIIAHSKLLKPQETTTFEFTAPAAGSYNYICTYPGHFPKMIGKLIVE
jgi:azurin